MSGIPDKARASTKKKMKSYEVKIAQGHFLASYPQVLINFYSENMDLSPPFVKKSVFSSVSSNKIIDIIGKPSSGWIIPYPYTAAEQCYSQTTSLFLRYTVLLHKLRHLCQTYGWGWSPQGASHNMVAQQLNNINFYENWWIG